MIYYLAVICSILFLISVILLVRKNKLDEKYSILWIIFSILILVLALNKNILEKISNLLGIYYAPATLFLVGFLFFIIQQGFPKFQSPGHRKDRFAVLQKILAGSKYFSRFYPGVQA